MARPSTWESLTFSRSGGDLLPPTPRSYRGNCLRHAFPFASPGGPSPHPFCGLGSQFPRVRARLLPCVPCERSTVSPRIVDPPCRSFRCGKWPVQSCVLQTVFRYACCMQWYNPRGITALPPSSYASRFEEFLAVHMLGLAHLSQSGQSSWQPFW